jgi:uncharacterized protein
VKILVSGAGGLVGSTLVPKLKEDGHDVRPLVRSRDKPEDIWWNTETGEINETALNRWGGPEAVVHLAGESIARRRWSKKQKCRIRVSRVEATEHLCDSLLRLERPPLVFLGASAIGYYGNRDEEILTEQSGPGNGFLPDLAIKWERGADRLAEAGLRVMHLRFGMILSGKGGALAAMLPIFKLGLGGPVGGGHQWVSWIALPDVVQIIQYGLKNSKTRGAYNAVSPEPVRNREFAKALGEVLRRRAILAAPGWALCLLLGEMSDALLLASTRVVPQRLLEERFLYRYTTLPSALDAALQESNVYKK